MNHKVTLLQKKLQIIFEKYPEVTKAGLFGSVARGEDNKESDIDILVEFSQNNKISYTKFLQLKKDLTFAMNRRIDLVQYKLIKPALRKYILPTEISIYEKNSETLSR